MTLTARRRATPWNHSWRRLLLRWRRYRSFGARSERRAARYFRRQGFRVLARNVRGGRGELDLIARKGALWVVVEVRARKAGWLSADRSVGADKRRHLSAAWARCRVTLGCPRGAPVRFDLALVDVRGRVLHIPGI